MAARFRYTVDDTKFYVSIFAADQTLPFIVQPTHPDGHPWGDKEFATKWAEARVAELEETVAKAFAKVAAPTPVVE